MPPAPKAHHKFPLLNERSAINTSRRFPTGQANPLAVDVAVVLAAGRGQRLGANHPKPLLPVDGQPMLLRSLQPYLESPFAQIIVVLGYQANQVEEALNRVVDERLHILECPHWSEGLGASLAFAVRHLDPAVERLVVGLADMPWIQPSTLTSLLASPLDCVAPAYSGQRGHPVLFQRRHFPTLCQLTGDRGAAAVLKPKTFPVDDAGVLRDVDRLSDL